MLRIAQDMRLLSLKKKFNHLELGTKNTINHVDNALGLCERMYGVKKKAELLFEEIIAYFRVGQTTMILM